MKKLTVALLLSLSLFAKAQATTKNIVSLAAIVDNNAIKGHLIDITKVNNPRLFSLINKEPKLFELLQLVYFITTSTKPVMLKFYADWCGPCKRMNPIIEAVAERFAGQLRIIAVDIDQYNQVADMFHISHVPTLVFFKKGKEVKRANIMSEEQLINAIEELL